jgi:transposase
MSASASASTIASLSSSSAATADAPPESPALHYVGLDVHQKRSSICILDPHGKQVKRLEVKGHWPAVLAEIARQAPRPFAICYEASCGYGYLYERLAPIARQVSVADPGQLALIYKSKKKNDKVDAAKLAKLLYLDMVPQVHVPKADVRAWRALITFRHRLMNRRVGIKNQIRALLRGLGVAGVPSGKRLWSGKGIAWLKAQPLDEPDALRRDLAAEELDEINLKLKRVDKELNRRADAHPGVTLLKTIPGVGVRTAEAMVAWIDDVSRFSRNKKVGSYFGLVPCQDASAAKNRLGHITGDGPAVVRKLLCEAGWRGIRCSGAIKAYFERIARDDPDRRKIALVATAHHLARVMAAMLRTGEAWREPTATATTKATTTATTTTTTTVHNRKDGCADGESASPPRKTAVT